MSKEDKKKLDLANCLCASIRRSSRSISQIYNQHLRNSGEDINANQISILVTISQIKKGTITQISNKLKMERTTLTRNLNILENAGWLKTSSGEDGRVKYLFITEKGDSVLIKIYPHWLLAHLQVINTLGDELDAFRKNLSKINSLTH